LIYIFSYKNKFLLFKLYAILVARKVFKVLT